MFRAEQLENRIKTADESLVNILAGRVPQDVVKSSAQQSFFSTNVTSTNHFVSAMVEFTQLHNCLFESSLTSLWTMHFVQTLKLLLNSVSAVSSDFEAEAYISRIYSWFCIKLRQRRELLARDETKSKQQIDSKPAEKIASQTIAVSSSSQPNEAKTSSAETARDSDVDIGMEPLPVRQKTIIEHPKKTIESSRPNSPIRTDPMFNKAFSDQIMSKSVVDVKLSSIADSKQYGISKPGTSKSKDSKSSKTDLSMLPKRPSRQDITNEIERSIITSELNSISDKTSLLKSQMQQNSNQRTRLREMSEVDPSVEVIYRYMQSRRIMLAGGEKETATSVGISMNGTSNNNAFEGGVDEGGPKPAPYQDDAKIVSWMVESVLSKREMEYELAVEKALKESEAKDGAGDKKKQQAKPKESKGAKGEKEGEGDVPPVKLPPYHARNAKQFMSTKFPYRWELTSGSGNADIADDCLVVCSARGNGGQIRRSELIECDRIYASLEAGGESFDKEAIQRGILTPQDRPWHMCNINMPLPRDGLMHNPLPSQFHKKYKPMVISKPKAKGEKKSKKK